MGNKMKVMVLVSLEARRPLRGDTCVSYETFWVAHSMRCDKFAKSAWRNILNEGTKKHEIGAACSETAAGRTETWGPSARSKHDGDISADRHRKERPLSLSWKVWRTTECRMEEDTSYSSARGNRLPKTGSSLFDTNLIFRVTIRTVHLWNDKWYVVLRTQKTNSVALSPQANCTDWWTATCRRNLVPTFVDWGVSRGQRGGSPTVVNLNFLDRSRYFSFK
jgi:hypothetical protein